MILLGAAHVREGLTGIYRLPAERGFVTTVKVIAALEGADAAQAADRYFRVCILIDSPPEIPVSALRDPKTYMEAVPATSAWLRKLLVAEHG
ncbi:MAG: hypothetical protein P4M01_10275 [Acidobacteriota bacterium]|nr:hypothetical protein [Acidobacteriota bacterium]